MRRGRGGRRGRGRGKGREGMGWMGGEGGWEMDGMFVNSFFRLASG